MQIAADRTTASRSSRQVAGRGRPPPGPRAAAALAAPGSAGALAANAPALAALLGSARAPTLPWQAMSGEPERVTGDDQLATIARAAAMRQGDADMLAARAPTASTSENRPELEALADNATVDAAIAADWTASRPNGPTPKKEHGFWILRAANGTITTQAFPSNGTNDSLIPGPMPATSIAFFHTHPNTTAEGYAQEPSQADINFANARGIPGLVMSHAGMFYFGPALP